MTPQSSPRANYWQDVTASARGGQQTSNTGYAPPAVKRTPDEKALVRAAGRYVGPGVPLNKALEYVNYQLANTARQQPTPTPKKAGSGSGRGYGGGGGGGVNLAALQASLDYMVQLAQAKQYTPTPTDTSYIDQARDKDLATAGGAWDQYDAYARQLTNPYDNVQLRASPVASDQNAYLASQGVSPNNVVTQNPDDPLAGFQNVLALAAAAQRRSNQSAGTEGQMGRANSIGAIGAGDLSLKAQITAADKQRQEAAAQQAMQARLELLAQIAPLVAQGAKAPDLAALGFLQ